MREETEKTGLFYIGWDVGGWNCDGNPKSRDAIAILDASLKLCGEPWRGNLRETINKSATSEAWLHGLFQLCRLDLPRSMSAVIAIDAPLGFSDEFRRLICELRAVGQIGESGSNEYLFRATERFLHEKGFAPLSAIKDQIGSQATKGMHVLSKFAPAVAECGVWTDDSRLTVIEAYPSACKLSKTLKDLRESGRYVALDHKDNEDALTCALVAYLFANKKHQLISPPFGTSATEGWIWMPRDAAAVELEEQLRPEELRISDVPLLAQLLSARVGS